MLRSKTIKKRTKNRLTLLRNLRKGKARLEDRCAFQVIPLPLKYTYPYQIHRLYGDVILMEHQNTLVTEPSLINNFKIFKNVQITETYKEKLVKVLAEDKATELTNWPELVQRLENSDSSRFKEWASSIKGFCERYENIIKDFETTQYAGLSKKTLEDYEEMTQITGKVRQNLIKNFPFLECKYQLKNGKIQLNEFIFSEKFLAEIGFTTENFASMVFQEGLPKIVPWESQCTTLQAQFRLDKFLKIDKDGFQSEDSETCLIMRSGYMKKIKLRVNYHSSYEKGILNFHVFATVIARQRPYLDLTKSVEDKMSTEFVRIMSNKEQEMAQFMSKYYDIVPEQRFTNIDRICLIKEIRDLREQQNIF